MLRLRFLWLFLWSITALFAMSEDFSCPVEEEGRPTALVIGGGPAGLTAALGLAKVCRSVIVVEKQKTFEPRGASLGIHKNGQKALKELSPELWERLEAASIETPWGGFLLPWWELRDLILEQVNATDNVEVRTGESFTDIIDDESAEKVKVLFESGLLLHAGFVVAADGVHSDVRNWLGLPPALSTGSRIFRGNIVVDESSASDQLFSLLDKGLQPLQEYGPVSGEGIFFILFNFHEKSPGRLAWVLSTTKEIDETTTPMSLLRQSLKNPVLLQLLEEIFEKSHPEHLLPYPSTKIVDFSDDALSPLEGRWGGRGRVTLAGDAAHAMRPTDGQGGNCAFEDAVVLYRTLQKHLSSDKHVSAESLGEFERTRLPRVKRIHDQQRTRYEKRMKGEKLEPYSKDYLVWLESGV